jgi:hypothetical protein
MLYCQFGYDQNQRRADQINYIKCNFVQRTDRSRKARIFAVAQYDGEEASLKLSLDRTPVASVDEIIFSGRRDRIRDMVRFLRCQNSGRHVVLLPINPGVDCLRRHVGRMKLW